MAPPVFVVLLVAAPNIVSVSCCHVNKQNLFIQIIARLSLRAALNVGFTTHVSSFTMQFIAFISRVPSCKKVCI